MAAAVPSRRGQDAVDWAKRQTAPGAGNYHSLCLKFVRSCFGVPPKETNAKKGWENAKKRHNTSDADSIPLGVPIWFKTSTVNWHVAISAGDGKCYSSDVGGRGRVGLIGIDALCRAWRITLLGWSEDVNGVTVYEKPKTPAKPKPKPEKPTTQAAKPKLVSRVSVKNLKKARYSDPPKNGHPMGAYANEVFTVETALAKTKWLKPEHVDGHYGEKTVGDGSKTFGGVTGFQKKHSGAKVPDGWLGKQELTKLFLLAGMRVQVTD